MEQPQWWEYEVNDLALVEAIRKQVRGDREATARMNSHLVGCARVVGVSEDAIRDACASDRCLTIYEP